MSEFYGMLSFSMLPLLLIFAFALVTPAIGAVLTLRNEIMLALALPSLAKAGIALGLLCRINSENRVVLYLFAAMFTLGATLIATSGNNSPRIRELRLAGMFVGGQILSLLFASLSSTSHLHAGNFLDGEVMAAGKVEVSVILLGCTVLLSTIFMQRRQLYSWCADEIYFRTVTRIYHVFTIMTYTIFAVTITVGVSTVGTILVTALLVVPALLGDVGRGGISRYAIMVMIIGLSGSILGFFIALAADLPPAVCSATGVGIVGIILRVGRS